MAKRTATTELTHDNWDREEGPEEAGTFAKASDDALKKRVIKVAKRRNPISSPQNEEGKSNVFGGFSGFGKTPVTTSTTSTFGFLSNLSNKQEAPKTNGTPDKKETETPDKKLDEYYAKLKGLNESVTEWIKKHVSTNPFINLQPIFKDYDKYINELEKTKNETSEKSDSGSVSTSNASTVTIPQFSFGSATTSANNFPKFSFGATTIAPSAGFSFGSTTTSFSSGTSTATISTDSSTSKPTFSFGSSAGDSGKFSFTSTVIKPADDPKTEEQEEDDEPPKATITPVVEEGHIYSIRCKVFMKKEGSFVDHGVGTLYLKPIPDNTKVQLIVRAETNLGKLICNFILSESIPMQRVGKKDVMLVCVPNQDMQPPPVPILLRVKSTEDADDLLKTLEKHKK